MASDPTAKGPRRNVRIGKYEVVAHIATGGMGAVYKARDTEIGRVVALKVLSPEMAAKPSSIERFRREARHAAKLRHENIVTLYEFGEANRTCFLVMEFIDGIDLFEYVSRHGALDPREALEIITQACRALDHAYRQGVVHRDVKPSNFLLTRDGERTIVKLTDLGLARQADNEEFRVTRAGTTVGTLDYMSPEQARDSGLADIRSDLYSLGSTWYHLLAGHAPFPKGGLGERLHRILHELPADVRQFNPRVNEAMAAVVHRLLAKRPSQRYQTPAELLRDLEALQKNQPVLTPRQVLEELAQLESEQVVSPSKKSRRDKEGRRTPRSTPASPSTKSEARKSTAEVPVDAGEESTRSYLWYGVGGAAAIIVLTSLVVALLLRRGRREEPLTEQTPAVVPQPRLLPPSPSAPPPTPQLQPEPKPNNKPEERTTTAAPSKKPNWPPLYRGVKEIDVAALRKEIEAPWATPAASGPTVELVVGRLPEDSSGKIFRSLADACKAIPAGATGVIELRDNGPFFDVPAAVSDRSVVIRAAAGYRPLLIWDVPRTLEQRRKQDRRDTGPTGSGALVFLDVKHGNLTLQDVQIAFKWPDAPSAGAALLRVEDGDLTVTGCTFSVAGKPRDGLTLARFAAPLTPSLSPSRGRGQGEGGGRCRFTRCYSRGAGVSVLDLDAPGARVLFDNCLLVGGEAPLLRVRAGNDLRTLLSVVRSTMICAKNLLEVGASKTTDHDPAFDWLGWDVLLCRKNPEVGGELLRLRDDISARHLNWRASNCLYAGWNTLLAGKPALPASDIAAWQRQWDRIDGDVALAEPWPTAVFPELAEVPATTYSTANSPVAYAASTGSEQLLGCDLQLLPPARDNWLSLTFDRFAIQAPAVPDDADAPEIPVANDGRFHGAALDLNQTDLGDYLQRVQQSYRLAPRIVLRLSGNGERLTTPIRLKESSLVLYFEPPAEKAEPLVLVPAGRGPAEALIEVEQGNLSLINGNLRFSDAAESRVVPWLIKLRGGDLRLFRTHLEVPPRVSGKVFRGLISLDGSGETAAERVRSCLVNESLLLSAHDGIGLQGIGGRVVLTQTLLIASDDALRLSLDSVFSGKANVQCLFDHATLAAGVAVVHAPDVKQAGPPAEPVIVQSHDCGFVNPFHTRRPSLVRYDGQALAHGLLVWQSENDGFDGWLRFGAVPAKGPLPNKPEKHASWAGLWGSPNLRRARLDLVVSAILNGDSWLPGRLAAWKVPGVKLDKLGLARKPIPNVPR
jgi:serine/threonine protein kinase